MSSALTYERFVRKAFNAQEKSGDPAGLASADWYNSGDSINKIKIATGYAICKFNNDYSNTKELDDPEHYKKMELFLNDVIIAENLNEIDKIIEEYKEFEKELQALKDCN